MNRTDEVQWWPIAVICGCMIGGGAVTTAIMHPAPYHPDPPEPPPAPNWRAVVGAGEQRHEIAVYGSDDQGLIQAAIQRDRECLPADARAAALQKEIRRLKGELKRVEADYASEKELWNSQTDRGQEIIEAVHQTGVTFDEQWLRDHGLTQTWKDSGYETVHVQTGQ